jgi:dipeptidyl aminopeptidase/acylaminoacyl peptidase
VKRFALLLAAYGALAAHAAAPEDRFGPADLDRLADVAAADFSPDGEYLVYSVTTTNVQADTRQSDLWRVRYDGRDRVQLTQTPDDDEWRPQWSPDGRGIAFLADRGGEEAMSQVWLLPAQGGEARRLTDFAGGVEDFAWAPDGAHLAVIAWDPERPAGAGQAEACSADRHRTLPVQGGHHRLPRRAPQAPLPVRRRQRQVRTAHAGRAR